MTSVTLPSTSGSLHGGFTSAASEETTSSEAEFESPRPLKRCVSTPLPESTKKRRKQSTPIRISAAETSTEDTAAIPEGKPSSSPSLSTIRATSPDTNRQCNVCQHYFNSSELLEAHMSSEHAYFKKEPEESLPFSSPQSIASILPVSPLSTNTATLPSVSSNQHIFYERSNTPQDFMFSRSDMNIMNDLQTKEWMNRIPFNATTNSVAVFMALPQISQTENMQKQQIRIFNPDAYCDLCNKEFCNKYFLKTHKANKHGIYTDSPSTDALPNPVNIPSYPVNTKLSTSVPSILESTSVKTESLPNIGIHPFSDVISSNYPSKLFTKNASCETEASDNLTSMNGLSTNIETDKQLKEEVLNEESASPIAVQTESTSFRSDTENMYFIPTSKTSPGQISKDIDFSNRLRKIGVMNPKAFCEICCKEYCNKYFLRTHKMKRHGIFIPEDKESSRSEGSSNNFNSLHNIQTSPLNLIIGEQNSDRKTTSPADVGCDICGIRFQNSSLAQLHNASVHPKLYNKDGSCELEDGRIDKNCSRESINEDLQKLQTMILQLNDLDVSKTASTSCNSCNKEFENRYFLHAHMMTEHGILLEQATEAEKPLDSESSTNNNTMCDICGKDLQSVEELKKHVLESHANTQMLNSKSTIDIQKDFEEAGSSAISPNKVGNIQISDRRMSFNMAPTSSYCDICNKELCNKYFMKTHMQRMHGIEIENGAQIGGVICDICNKELCSKYFLRVHKHNTHGIVEYGSSLLPPRKNEGDTINPEHIPVQPQPPVSIVTPDPALKPAEITDLSHRYFSHFTEVCSICSRRFRSTKWLKAHLFSDHGQMGADRWAELEQQLHLGKKTDTSATSPQPSTIKIPNGSQDNKVGIQNVLSNLFGVDEGNTKTYQCSLCSFTTPLLPLMFVHERSHTLHTSELPSISTSMENALKCPICAQTFSQPELLQHHIFSHHPLLPIPPYFGSSTNENVQQHKQGDNIQADQNENAIPKCEEESDKKTKKSRGKMRLSLSSSADIDFSLKDIANKAQMPASYALPSGDEDYVMQAFILEEAVTEERFTVPAVVFLPVLHKQPAPLTVTFNLTPA